MESQENMSVNFEVNQYNFHFKFIEFIEILMRTKKSKIFNQIFFSKCESSDWNLNETNQTCI